MIFSDFVAVLPGPIKDKVEWISEIDSVLGAPSHVAWGSQHAVRTRYCQGCWPCAQTEYELVLMDTEGSMRWQMLQTDMMASVRPRQPLSLI